jgi:hypothetical protein
VVVQASCPDVGGLGALEKSLPDQGGPLGGAGNAIASPFLDVLQPHDPDRRR